METTTPLTLPENWFWSFMEDRWQCALTQKSKLTYGKMCTGDERLNLDTLGDLSFQEQRAIPVVSMCKCQIQEE